MLYPHLYNKISFGLLLRHGLGREWITVQAYIFLQSAFPTSGQPPPAPANYIVAPAHWLVPLIAATACPPAPALVGCKGLGAYCHLSQSGCSAYSMAVWKCIAYRLRTTKNSARSELNIRKGTFDRCGDAAMTARRAVPCVTVLATVELLFHFIAFDRGSTRPMALIVERRRKTTNSQKTSKDPAPSYGAQDKGKLEVAEMTSKSRLCF